MEVFIKLSEEQRERGERMVRLIRNMKKDSIDRKNSSYIAKKKNEFDKLWEEFEETHKQLETLGLPNEKYFIQNYYGQVRESYDQAMKLIAIYTNIVEASKDTGVGESEPSKLQGNVQQTEERKEEMTVKDFFLKFEDTELSTQEQGLRIKKQMIRIENCKKAIQQLLNTFEGNTKTFYGYKTKEISELWNSILNLHEEIMTYATRQDMKHAYFEDMEYDSLQSMYFIVMLKLHNAIKDTNNNCSSEQNTKNNEYDIKLPRIVIPTFDGNYKMWTSFHDIYVKVIHTNKRLGNAEKMQYLKTSLKGEAMKLIQHLTSSDVNYNAAWDLITTRYNNKRILFSTHVDTLLNQPMIVNESAIAIKQLHDTTKECMHAIKNLQIVTDSWSPLVAHIIIKKLDKETHKQFEQSLKDPREIQQLDEILHFLETRFHSLEAVGEIKRRQTQEHKTFLQRQENAYQPFKQGGGQRKNWQVKNYFAGTKICRYCNGQHTIYSCQKFHDMPIGDRISFVKQHKICMNCLNHDTKEKCFSLSRCCKCKQQHHSLLHRSNNTEAQNNTQKHDTKTNIAAHATNLENKKQVTARVVKKANNVLLATALLKAKTIHNTYEYLRALIDPGSQATFITENAAQRLGWPRTRTHTQISGMAESSAGVSHSKVEIELMPRYPSDFNIRCEALVLTKLTKTQPDYWVNTQEVKTWENILLADPTYDTPGPIDIVLGADVFTDIILEGIKKGKSGILAQRTVFGWILSGRNEIKQTKEEVIAMISHKNINDQLQKFWEVENTAEDNAMSNENIKCEEYYEFTTKRNRDGTYTVKIPFKETENILGKSRPRALARLYQMERRFLKDNVLKENYKQFMEEYLRLGHMKLVTKEEKPDNETYYMPHQAVIREESTTTKLRVVFDASTKTDTSVSLNDLMYSGPKLQQDLQQILLRWRIHKFVFAADIEKMYRQIKIADEHQNYQRILWRSSLEEKIQEYKLTTVTYGTKAAPYLAIKTLQTLANDEAPQHPEAAKIILRDFYVDDLLSGAGTIKDAKRIQAEVITVLRKGGFNLRKWKANTTEILNSLPENSKGQSLVEINEEESVKTLGIYWSPTTDKFQFKVKLEKSNKTPTKRMILADIARLYDPLGWLTPVTVKAKILLQELWVKKYSWDEALHPDLVTNWLKFRAELGSLENIEIPRWIQYIPNGGDTLEIHGFSDASEKAYGAVVYSKVVKNNKPYITLLVSKTRVAPLKKLTIPRLELCAAQLLANLIKQVVESLDIKEINIYAWTDSTIVLAWINGEAKKWKSFVSNRVTQIQMATKAKEWRHVKSEDNPADLASRGIEPPTLKNNTLWWTGPSWLKKPESEWPINKTKFETDKELKKQEKIVTTAMTISNDILYRYSTLNKLVHVVAYCFRFVNKCKRVATPFTDHLSVEETNKAKQQIICMTQQESFAREIQQIKSRKPLEKKSNIASLNPFLDECEILRVYGRLKNANISYNEKYPIILPHRHIITELIIRDAHLNTMHGGNEATLAYIRRKYWIIGARNKIKQELRKCVVCQRYKGITVTQIMGQLPTYRVTPSKPFTNTGIDYAGPIQIRTSKGRGNKSYKGYLAIFICMTTKALHIEVVSDMTTEAFMAAFRRFTARRGTPSNIYTDNGTTFVGAKKAIEENCCKAIKEIESEIISRTSDKLSWHFIPPAAPHFGGIWEAGVKSIKYHLKRIIGDSTLTFEELCTLIYQIEACLNSRPLCPVSNDPDSSIVLTPAHFLIGEPLVTPAEPSKLKDNICLSQRWKYIQKITQDFWKKWQTEYLSRLQQRPKWKKGNYKVEPGAIVLIKDENCPPTKWPLARIIETHPGEDGIVRVVTLKCKENTIIKRPVTKICFLPIDTETESISQQLKSNEQTLITTLLSKSDTVTVDKNRIEQSINERSTRKMKRKIQAKGITLIPMLLTIMILCGNVQLTKSQYAIQHPEPGLYVEHAGEARIRRGTLRIDINIKLNVTDENRKINNLVNQMEKACHQGKKFEAETHCEILLQHLKERKGILQNELENINALKAKKHGKRGLLGKLLQSIFGVNDEVYTEIDNLHENQELLKQTVHHQATILVSTMTKLDELGTKASQKFNLITDKLNKVISEVNKVEGWYDTIDRNKVGLQLLAAYQITNDLFNDMEKKYLSITTAKPNKRSILDFISHPELQAIIKNATTKLPPQLAILEESELRTEINVQDTNIIISEYVSITEHTTYELSKLTPIPQKIGKSTYIAPDISSSFLAVDYNNQKYFEITEGQLKDCITLHKHSFLCVPNVVSSIETNTNCAIEQLYHRQKRKDCPMKKFPVTNIAWKHLYMPNTWLFIADIPTEVAIICNGHREDVLLNEIGIIQINQECFIQTKLNILFSEIRNQVNIKTTLLKLMNYSSTSLQPAMQLQQSKKEKLEPILSRTDSWSELSEQHEYTDVPLQWKYIGHHAATASISITTTIFILIIGWKVYACTKGKGSKPTYNKTSKEDPTQDFVLSAIEGSIDAAVGLPRRQGPGRMFAQQPEC